jgi:hypothetical protein
MCSVVTFLQKRLTDSSEVTGMRLFILRIFNLFSNFLYRRAHARGPHKKLGDHFTISQEKRSDCRRLSTLYEVYIIIILFYS